MKKLRSLIFTALLLLASFLQITPVFADANNFRFKDLTIDYYLHKTSANTSEMEVVETFTAEFPNYNQNHGIERTIPFLNQNDTNLTMESANHLNIDVTRNGSPEPYTVKTDSTSFTVRIGSVDSYVQGEQVYVLKYKFVNLITEFDESRYSTDPYQELYWDTNGTGWAQRFDNVTVNLHMDNEVLNNIIPEREISYTSNYKNKSTIHENNKTTRRLAAWCYVGPRGSSNQNRCEINDIEDGIQYKTSALGSGENMTIVLNFNANTFTVPENNFVKTLNYKSANFNYYLSRDENGMAKLKVEEKFIALFPTLNEERYIIRYVPYVNSFKNRFITKSQDDLGVKVTLDGKNITPDHIRANDDGYFTITVKNEENTYIHGEHEFTFEYELQDMIEEVKDEEDGSVRQYLNINPLGIQFLRDVSNLKATIHIDDSIRSEIIEGKYTDELDEEYYLKSFCNERSNLGFKNHRCLVTETNDGYSYELGDISSRDFMEFTIFFKDGTFKISEPNRNFLVWHIFGIFIVIVGGFTFIFLNKTYKKVSSKIKYLKNLPVVPQYAPIKDITVAEIGENYLRPTGNLKVATMLELIVNKKIELRREEKSGILKKGYKWFVKIIDASHLSTEQQDLLVILNNGVNFEGDNDGKEIEIKHHSYSNKLETAFNDYDRHVKRALKNDKMFEEKDNKSVLSSKNKITGGLLKPLGIFFAVYIGFHVAIFAFFAFVEFYTESTNYTKFAIFEGLWLIPIMVILAIIVTTALPLISIHSEKYKLRTERGLEISRYTDGLKLYIKMAEADRIKFLQSVDGVDTSDKGIVKLHEKLLPYAALFGLEKSWMKELEKYYQLEQVESPYWYADGFSYSALNSIIRSATSRPIDTSSSSSGGSWSGGGFSSSSGSSGGGGGGFSGGGGGGGGGGGW